MAHDIINNEVTMRSLYWIRTDLRLKDNLALDEFCKQSKEGMLCWCPTPTYERAGAHRKEFVDDCVDSFSSEIAVQGHAVTRGNRRFKDELPGWVDEHQIESIFFTREFATEEVEEEKAVQAICAERKIRCVSIDQTTLIAESDLPFPLKQMPLVFSEFRKKIESGLKMNRMVKINPPKEVASNWPLAILKPNQNVESQVKQSKPNKEQMAAERVAHYFWQSHAVRTYKETRNGMLEDNDSTRLSRFLNQGCLSAREVYEDLKKYEDVHGANESTYWVFFELLWRDYFKFLSRKEGKRIFQESGLHETPVVFRPDQKLFQTWCEGKTADSFINANMHELNSTGWMSNRGRQNVASYLVHDLGLPWTWGAAYFETHLIDYDPDLNWGNWLYVSGRGTDPRARKFNPRLQAEVYDPAGLYQKKWNGENNEA